MQKRDIIKWYLCLGEKKKLSIVPSTTYISALLTKITSKHANICALEQLI